MQSNLEKLKNLLEKIRQTPDDVIERAIDRLSQKIIIEKMRYTMTINYIEKSDCNEFQIESEKDKWKEKLPLVA